MTLCQLCLADRPVRSFVAPPGRAIVEANIAAGRHALSVPRYLRYYPVPEGCQSIGPSAP